MRYKANYLGFYQIKRDFEWKRGVPSFQEHNNFRVLGRLIDLYSLIHHTTQYK